MARKQLKWIRQRPEIRGYYYFHQWDGPVKSRLLVFVSRMVSPGPMEAVWFWSGGSVDVEDMDGWWYGPLNLPEPKIDPPTEDTHP